MVKQSIKTIRSVAGYMRWLAQIQQTGGFLFRGQANDEWEVEPSSLRRIRRKVTRASQVSLLQYSEQLLIKAREGDLHYHDNRELADLPLLARLQHHRAATCLIDFTENPLVALWFACEEEKNKRNRLASGRVFALADDMKLRKVTFTERDNNKIRDFFISSYDAKVPFEHKLWKWRPAGAINRIITQQSVFIFGDTKKAKYQQVTIPAASKQAIRDELKQLGITEAELFRDFVGFAEQNSHDKPWDGGMATSWSDHGLQVLQAGDYGRAIEMYDEVINIDADNAVAYFNRAYAKHQLEQYEAAIADYDRAVALDAEDTDAYINRGNTKVKLQWYEAAIADYDRANALEPNDAVVYYNRGVAKGQLEIYDAAIADFDQAIKLDSKYVNAYINRGNLKVKLRQYEAAIADYDQAITLDPKGAVAYYNRGLAKMQQQKDQAAISDYDRAIILNREYADAYFNRGNVKVKLRQYEAAIADYDQAIALVPKDADIYINRGNVNYVLKQYQAAIADYDQAIALDPKCAVAYNNRGFAKEKLGDYEAAKADFAKANELGYQPADELS